MVLDFTLETSTTCNYSNCIMCFRQFSDIHKGKDWTMEQLEHVLDEINVEKDIVAQIGGNQEPLMYKHFYDALKAFDKRGYRTLFTTNGLLLGKNINYLPQGIGIFISIDGGIEEDYRHIRGKELTPILDNIVDLRIRRPDIPAALHCILLKDRILGYKELADFCVRYKLPIQFMYPIIFDKEFEKKYSPFYENDYNKDVAELFNYCTTIESMTNFSSLGIKERICIIPFTSPFINVNGDVFPCCYIGASRDSDVNKQIWHTYYQGREIEVPQYQYNMGNIFNDSFKSIWSSNKWEKLRHYINDIVERFDKRERYCKDPKNRYLGLLDKYDPNREFSYCEVCTYRWCRAV